jgi:hypothetical protein
MYRLNDLNWCIRLVGGQNGKLKRSDGKPVMGLCDRNTQTIYIADNLTDYQFKKVLIHEICHSAMASYDVALSLEQEEIICQIISEYGEEIIGIADTFFSVMRRKIS